MNLTKAELLMIFVNLSESATDAIFNGSQPSQLMKDVMNKISDELTK